VGKSSAMNAAAITDRISLREFVIFQISFKKFQFETTALLRRFSGAASVAFAASSWGRG
jgi:hypothetical protein